MNLENKNKTINNQINIIENQNKISNSLNFKNNYIKMDKKNLKIRKNFDNKYKTFQNEFIEKIICIRKINKVTTGGRRLRFSVAIAIGNRKGMIGFGISKANEVPDAIKKAIEKAKKNLNNIILTKNNNSILYEVKGKYCSSEILLKPAKEGIGIKAGGAVRDILELVGIQNIYSKTFKSRNKINLAKAVIISLNKIKKSEYFIKIKKNT